MTYYEVKMKALYLTKCSDYLLRFLMSVFFFFLPSYMVENFVTVIRKDHWQSDKRKSPGSSTLNTCTSVSRLYVFLGHLAVKMPKSQPCSYVLL